jgi:hypothetical protein
MTEIPNTPAAGHNTRATQHVPLRTRWLLLRYAITSGIHRGWHDWNPYYTAYAVGRRVPYALALAATGGIATWLYLSATWAGGCILNAKGTGAICVVTELVMFSGRFGGIYAGREFVEVPTWAHVGADIVWALSWLVPFAVAVGAISAAAAYGPAAWAELKRRAGVRP